MFDIVLVNELMHNASFCGANSFDVNIEGKSLIIDLHISFEPPSPSET